MTKEKINILYLCSWFPCRSFPTNGNFIHRHARCVTNEVNLKILAICEDCHLKKQRFEFSEGKEDDVPYLIVYYKTPKIKIFKYWYKLIAWRKGYLRIKQQMPRLDLIHVHVLIEAGFWAYFSSFIKNIPYLITEHSIDYLGDNFKSVPFFFRPLIRRTAQRSALLLPVSDDLRKNMERHGLNSNYKIIPNVVNTNLFTINPLHKTTAEI